jgi:hypothetical protein
MRLPFTVRDRDVQANFDKLVGLLGFNKLRKGTGTLTWGGGTATTGSASVTHGLGSTPSEVIVTANNPPVGVGIYTGTPGATTFTVAATTVDGSTPAAATAFTFSWVAFA